MAVQSNDILYAERQGIGGTITAQDIANLVVLDWGYYATNIKYTDLTGTITTGKVLTGEIDNLIVYRFITTAKTGLYPTEDSFYSTFDGTILSDLIITR